MKKTFSLKCGTFGAGKPKICVPIVGVTQAEIWKKAEELEMLSIDMVEWRADFYEDVCVKEKLLKTLEGLKERLLKKDLLFTIRTKGEGGQVSFAEDTYYEWNRLAAGSGWVSLVDVEAFFDEHRTAEEMQKLHALGCKVIASNHDFYGTPSLDTMVHRLVQMEQMGADAAKLAVMPLNRQDVIRLLEASVTADEKIGIPLVTMSMGSLGVISRLAGILAGSAMTFAAVGEVSAPGQIPAEHMTEILKLFE